MISKSFACKPHWNAAANEVCPRCVELAARVIELEGELARMRTSRTPMSAVERALLLAERQRKHYEKRKGVLPEMTFRDGGDRPESRPIEPGE
jgi:hypothetical protein